MTIQVFPSSAVPVKPGMITTIEFMVENTVTTATQILTVADYDCHALGAGTSSATGGGLNNIYSLPDGTANGQVKWIGLGTDTSATGLASVTMTSSATGNWVFQTATHFLKLEWQNDRWHVLQFQGCTHSTTT